MSIGGIAMNNIRCLARVGMVIGMILVIAACAQALPSQVSPMPTTHSVMPTIMTTQPPAPMATATPLGGPLALLGPLPNDCPSGPAPQIISPDFGSAVGANPAWAGAGNFRNQAPLALIWDPTQARAEHDENGWGHKFLWVVATSYQGVVTFHGANLRDGSPLYPEAQDAEPASTPTTLVVDTRNPNIANRDPQWTQFPGGLTVPKAGCYYLEADWPGGHWRITFAAGMVSSYT